MNHGLNNTFLYSAYRIETSFVNDKTGKKEQFTGTCFFIRSQNNEMLLITNRHCIDISFKDKYGKYNDYKIEQVKIIGKNENPQTGLPNVTDEFFLLNVKTILPTNDKDDIVCLKSLKILNPKGGDVIIRFSIPYDFLADEKRLSEKLCVCDFVAFPGYPAWYDRLNQSPILRTGSIASDPRFNYSWTGEDEGNCIAYEAFSSGGSSGSPVFAIQKGFEVGQGIRADEGFYREVMLIGINAGHLNDENTLGRPHSGISYFYKSSVILELINRQ
jgi:hypothetical protein